MTTQVEKALPEPAAEPVSPSKTTSFNEEMLSPVSKLELARKYAAEEQQKRVNAACERMVVVKKAQIVKKLEIEERLENHIKQQEPEHEDGETKQGGRLSSIAMRLVDAFKKTTDENNANASNKQPEDEEAGSPTRQLLRATRTKLNALVSSEEEVNLPATNYHLKQLGLVNEKINIYAPVHEQQSELRRRRESAIRCQEKYMQENAEYDEGYKSAEDSDFAPEDDEEEEEEEEDSDDDVETDSDIDEDEVRQLIADQKEFSQSASTIKKAKKTAKKAQKANRSSPFAVILGVVVLILSVVLAVFFAEQQTGFCRALVDEEPRAEDARIVTCSAVLELQALILRIARLVTLRE